MVIWDVAAGQQLWSIPRPEYMNPHGSETGYKVEMSFSPDGQTLAVGYSWGGGDVATTDPLIRIFTQRTGGLVAELELEGGGAFPRYPRLTWSPAGRYLAFESRDGFGGFIIWDVVAKSAVTFADSNDPVPLAWHPDGCHFATGHTYAVKVWDCQTGEVVQVFELEDFRFAALSWSRDGSRLAAGSEHVPYVAIWDADSGEMIHSIDQGGSLIGFGTDNQTIIGGLGVQNSVAVWTLNAPTIAEPTAYLRGLSGINSLAWSPDGTQIASTVDEGRRVGVTTWDVANASPIVDMEETAFVEGYVHIDWSPVGALTALSASSAWSYEPSLRLTLVDFANNTVRLLQYSSIQAYFSPDGSRLAAQNGGVILFYNVANGATLTKQIEVNPRQIKDFAWSPDGTQIAVATVSKDEFLMTNELDGRVEVWDVAAGTLLYTLGGLNGPALSVAWSPDGSRIAASNNIDVMIWLTGKDKTAPDLTLFSLIERGEYSRLGLTEIDWSPDGTMIAAAYGMPITRFYCNGCGFGQRGQVIVWDAATAERLYRFDAHTAEVQTVAFSPDGSLLASGSMDGTILLWHVSP